VRTAQIMAVVLSILFLAFALVLALAPAGDEQVALMWAGFLVSVCGWLGLWLMILAEALPSAGEGASRPPRGTLDLPSPVDQPSNVRVLGPDPLREANETLATLGGTHVPTRVPGEDTRDVETTREL